VNRTRSAPIWAACRDFWRLDRYPDGSFYPNAYHLIGGQARLGPAGFVHDLASEFAHADSGDVAGEAPVSQRPGDVEVLDHDRAVLADQAGSELVQPVAAGVAWAGDRSWRSISVRSPRGHGCPLP
jgi:hypothetical protein